MCVIVTIFIDAVILVTLIKAINDDDVDLPTAFFVAAGASIGTFVLVLGCTALLGIAGLFVGAVIAAGLLGVAVAAVFGVEVKRAMLIAVLFFVAHIIVELVWNMIFKSI